MTLHRRISVAIFMPDRISARHRYHKHVAAKFDGSKKRRSPGRPRTDAELESATCARCRTFCATPTRASQLSMRTSWTWPRRIRRCSSLRRWGELPNAEAAADVVGYSYEMRLNHAYCPVAGRILS